MCKMLLLRSYFISTMVQNVQNVAFKIVFHQMLSILWCRIYRMLLVSSFLIKYYQYFGAECRLVGRGEHKVHVHPQFFKRLHSGHLILALLGFQFLDF